jgi:uncharacterized protein
MGLLHFALYLLGLVIFLVLTQDIHIFPGAFLSRITYFWQRNKPIPCEVESIFVATKDNVSLELWRYAPCEQSEYSKYVGLVFHGNGASLENFIFVQMWLAEMGIASYGFDYRGFGRSSGWPSERGIYLDSDTVWDYVLRREQLDHSRIIVIGISVGSAPAARIAGLHQPKVLLLSSPFTDLRSVVRAQPIAGLFSSLIWTKFPTISYLKELRQTHLLLAHGLKDNLIPSSHSVELERAYKGQGKVRRLTSPTAGHNGTFYDLRHEIKETLISWL